MVKSKIFFIIVLIFLIIFLIDSFRPIITVHAEHGTGYLRIYGGYGVMDGNEPSLDLNQEMNNPSYLTNKEFIKYKMSIFPDENKVLILSLQNVLDKKMFWTNNLNMDLPKVTIYERNKINFCRLNVYINSKGEVARAEESGWFCIK
jgi:hypothetical protein